MTRLVVTSKVGSDGVLHLDLPLGPAEADQEVQVIVESARPGMSQEQWREWVQDMAGSISDPAFERPPQGDYEQRESLS